MSRAIRFSAVAPLAASILVLALAVPAQAIVIHRQTGLPGDQTCPNGDISWHNDSQEGRVLKFTVREGSGKERCEFAVGRRKLQNGQTVYIGWKSRVIAPSSGDWNNIFQLKCHGKFVANHPLLLRVGGKRLHMLNYEDVNGKLQNRQVWSTPLPHDKWFSIVLKVHYSESRSQGSVQIWYNDKLQKLDNGKTIHNGQTWDGSENNVHFGIYRTARINGNQVHYIKDAVIATTFDEANPNR
jgi:hypothetical protein